MDDIIKKIMGNHPSKNEKIKIPHLFFFSLR